MRDPSIFDVVLGATAVSAVRIHWTASIDRTADTAVAHKITYE